ncbi:MAG: hypothetical protein IIC24_07420, partial [Chloroflexi bacterium]|nr:hypothetical protein [Chloroflexota bacterium]
MSWPIIGNRAVVDRIEAEFSRERLSHASLVHGPQGVGKMTLAVTLAMALSCTDSPKPCGACAPCKRIERGLHTDVLLLGLDEVEVEEDVALLISGHGGLFVLGSWQEPHLLLLCDEDAEDLCRQFVQDLDAAGATSVSRGVVGTSWSATATPRSGRRT